MKLISKNLKLSCHRSYPSPFLAEARSVVRLRDKKAEILYCLTPVSDGYFHPDPMQRINNKRLMVPIDRARSHRVSECGFLFVLFFFPSERNRNREVAALSRTTACNSTQLNVIMRSCRKSLRKESCLSKIAIRRSRIIDTGYAFMQFRSSRNSVSGARNVFADGREEEKQSRYLHDALYNK